jgi:tetratricopeptide (TPR) repeat protein
MDEALNTPISPAAEHAYKSATALLRYIEFSGTKPSSERNKRRYGDLLFKFSQLASKQQDWWAARRALEQLRSLLGDDFEGFKVSYNLGRAYLACADSGATDGNELRHKALGCFAEAAHRSPFDPDSFFWLAYVQDDLGMLDLAVANNRRVLERRHGYSLAKYNIVISRIKKMEMDEALEDLLAITPQDEEGLETLRGALGDTELRPLLQHPTLGSKARWWLEYHQDPTRFPD